jgi:dTDP-4-amino-4,6-dideoxygalactose transaminase
MSVPDAVRHGASEVIFETHPVLGYNYRMTDIQAAVGREQLKRIPEIVTKRRKLAARYNDLLSNNFGVETPIEPQGRRSNWQSYSVTLPAHCDQHAVMQTMLDAGIATRRGIMCAHREAPYAGDWRLPNSEFAQDRRILLPLFHQITDDEQSRVAETLKGACS